MNDVFRAVLIAHYSEIPVQTENEIREDEAIEFDYISEPSVDNSSNITSSPTVEGDYVADHIYRNPITESLNGTFSLNGYKPTSFSNYANRLVAIQHKFEEIKDKGIRCTIVTRKNSSDDETMFKTRENMYLHSISWTEKANSLDFRFTFTEVITATIDELEYDTNVVDDTLPALTEAKSTSAFGSVIDINEVSNLIDEICHECGLTDAEFYGTCIALGIGGGVATFAIGALAVGLIAAGGPVGWIVGGAALLGYGLWNWIVGEIDSMSYKVEQFKYTDDKEELAKELKRYSDFKSEIVKQLKSIENEIDIYELSSNENQECIISIDDTYYSFKFIRDNNSQLYKCDIYDYTNETTNSRQVIDALPDISACTDNNAMFITETSGYYVYSMCPILANLSGTEYENAKKDLRNYKIVVMKFRPTEYAEMMKEIIRNAILV